MSQSQNVTSLFIPTDLLNSFTGRELKQVLEDYINTTANERKSLSAGEKNYAVKNIIFHQDVNMKKQNCRKKSIHLSPTERNALKILTGTRELRDAVTVALCGMRALNSRHPEHIIPASPCMGGKRWFLNEWFEIIEYIKDHYPNCTGYIEPFLGSGILAENIADKFRSVIANYFDPQEGDYFQTIRKYPSMFKSLVLCFDRATSTLDEKQEKEIMTSIIKSLETMQPCKALKLLVALEFFLKQNKIPTKKYKTKLCNLKTTADVSLDISECVPAIFECIKEWEKNKRGKTEFQGQNKYPLQARGLHKKVDCLGKEANALQKIKLNNKDALTFLNKYIGKPEYLIVCDPPYFDTREYEVKFSYDKHKKLADLLKKHAEAGGCFIYFGRPQAPRSRNKKAGIDYSERDKVYKSKYDELFMGKGFFYKDYPYPYDPASIKERVTTNLRLPGYAPY